MPTLQRFRTMPAKMPDPSAQDAQSWSDLAATHADARQWQEAANAAVKAAQLAPDHLEAWRILAGAVMEMGQIDLAVRCFTKITQLDPTDAQSLRRLGECFLAMRHYDRGAETLHLAAALAVDNPRILFQYAQSLELQNKYDDARDVYHRVQQIAPRDVTRLTLATQLKFVYDSTEDLLRVRDHIRRSLDDLLREGFQLPIDRIPASPLMLLAYQGFNDRDIVRDYAKLMAPPPPIALDPRPAGRDRIRIGFISAALRNHTIGQVNKGLIAGLDREKFEVIVLAIGDPGASDSEAQFIREHADSYVLIPTSLADARTLIARQQLDVLLYTDIGMDATTYTLAHSRLAPMQCVTWGHPSTSGIATIDYYISSALLESDEAPQHYTEKLVQLSNLSVYYYRPAAPQAVDRRAFGFSDDVHIYGCLQSSYKFHPEFDALMDEILRRDPRGRIVIPRGSSRCWDDALMRRWSRTMPATIDRVRLIDPLPYGQYLALTAACDVMLAPIHFGAGNTSYEALAFGVPVITLPSKMLKGRITHALYRAMNVMDCVADSPAQYVDLAVRIGSDRALRQHVSEKILAANSALYENPAGVRDLENFLLSIKPAEDRES